MVNAAPECALGRGTQGDGVRDVRNLCMAVGLTAALTLLSVSTGLAGSADYRTQVIHQGTHQGSSQASYRSNVSQPVSRASETPPNCVRESCGRLWCWNQGGSKR